MIAQHPSGGLAPASHSWYALCSCTYIGLSHRVLSPRSGQGHDTWSTIARAFCRPPVHMVGGRFISAARFPQPPNMRLRPSETPDRMVIGTWSPSTPDACACCHKRRELSSHFVIK